MFRKAQRQNVPIKLAITGPSGAGKTYSALRLATGLAGEDDTIAVVDTENRSASLYSDDFDFDVADIEPPYRLERFINAIEQAVEAGYAVCILDTASHFWKGILQYKSKLDQSGNSFANWQKVNQYYDGILEAVLQSDIHLIACMRSKVDYVVEENEKGKADPRKVGLAPVMRDGVEYEFTTVFDLDTSHRAQASKDRTGLFEDRIFQIS